MPYADARPSWELMLLFGLSMLAVLQWPPYTRAAPVFTAEPMIVSQTLLSGQCTDYTGTVRADLDEWTTSSGSCDRVVCHVEPSGNYTVTHNCRPREPSENPDTDNCVWTTNSALAYPDCCPQLTCSAASPLTTVDPTSCYDLSSPTACGIWQNVTSNCTDTTHVSYNYTQVFCRSTCGLC